MSRLGLLDTLGLAAALALAAPLVHFALILLGEGRPLGWAFLLFAGLLVVGQHFLTTPQDLPAAVAERVVGGAAKDPEKDD
jgi:hypothetical protein